MKASWFFALVVWVFTATPVFAVPGENQGPSKISPIQIPAAAVVALLKLNPKPVSASIRKSIYIWLWEDGGLPEPADKMASVIAFERNFSSACLAGFLLRHFGGLLDEALKMKILKARYTAREIRQIQKLIIGQLDPIDWNIVNAIGSWPRKDWPDPLTITFFEEPLR